MCRKVVSDDVGFPFRELRDEPVGQTGDEFGADLVQGRFAYDLPAGNVERA